MASLNLGILDPAPASATFEQDASFRLEQPIGSMSISPSGRDVVLASKEGLHIVDLDSPYSPPRYLPHRTPWEVADVQWSPFALRDYWIVSTSNQKALVWNVGSYGDRDAIEFVLHGHSRAITDINFSAHHPETLATCAVDSFVHVWDLRTPSRPAFSFSDWFAGATQVKFSRQDEHLIASSHDRFLHIWDRRKGAYPIKTIEAHETKICGIDWNRFEGSKIVTCSLDKTIKFWNINNPSDEPERTIETGFPVWRARHTPFGWGLLAMSQRGSSELYLYDRRPIDGVLPTGQIRAVTTFAGHKGQVKEFLWRSRGVVNEVDHRDFQLVTWGADRELRLHRVPEEVFHDVGYERGVTKAQRLNFTRRGARYRTFRDGAIEPYSPSEPSFRTESFPSQGPFHGLRSRHGTNIGMNKVQITQVRGWLHGARKERRTGMHGKTAARQDINPIAWMKNVKIASWDPDSLADEITQVGEKFQKLEFDAIDISQRKAIMSLQGPWGDNSATVYVRVEFRFPKAYPRGMNAMVTLQKSNSISPEVHRLLSTEVHTIAETYASRQRGCIEAIVRYLLHEQSMEQIVSWLLGDTISDSKTLDPADLPEDLSSDSDDENLTGPIDASDSAANIRVPIAKECGALWANDGRLVCFFPKEPKQPESVLAKLEGSEYDDTQSNRLFDAFGRLQTDSPARKMIFNSSNPPNESDSDTSDVGSMFSSSSSSSSTSSETEDILRDRFTPYRDGMPMGIQHHRSRSGDRSNPSATVDGMRTNVNERINVVSIHHDVLDLIPAKKSMAEKYRMLGPGRDVCEHNAQAADQERLVEVASIWRLAGLILDQRVPLEILTSTRQGFDDIVVFARRSDLALAQINNTRKQNDKAPTNARKSNLKEYIRWGKSPFASMYLTTAIFNYFEKEADIQTLAVLSCVFLQAQHSIILERVQSARSYGFHASQMRHQLSSSLDVPHSAPNKAVLRSQDTMQHAPGVTAKGGSELHLVVPRKASDHRQYNMIHSELDERGSRTGKGPVYLQFTPAGTSPERLRSDHRSTAATSATFKASPSAQSQNYSRSPPSGSSTAASSLKRVSPSTSVATSTWAGALFGRDTNSRGTTKQSVLVSSGSGDASSIPTIRTSVSSVNFHDSRRDSRHTADGSRASIQSSTAPSGERNRKANTGRKRLVRTTLHNQDRFDIDGYASTPLLEPQSLAKHRAYRAAYADQLGMWSLWVQRAEILQLDALANGFVDPTQHSATNPAVLKAIDTRGLEVTECCSECGNALVQLAQQGTHTRLHCVSHKCLLSMARISKSQVCSVCQEVMRGLLIPCLQCGHVSCYDCAQSWFGATGIRPTHNTNEPIDDSAKYRNATDDQDTMERRDGMNEHQDESKLCPTGCGCPCPTLTEIKVPWPTEPEEDKAAKSKAPVVPPAIIRRSNTSSATASSTPTGRPRPEHGLDTALGAMMALSSRSRATSTTNTAAAAAANQTNANANTTATSSLNISTSASTSYEDAHGIEDELMPWASGRFTSLGRGIGGGLSRGLSNRSSDATIRKA